MATLIIGRLHNRYHVERPSHVGWLDACLGRLVGEELERALEDLAGPADHICVSTMTVPVRLTADGDTAAAARSWAGQIAAALARRMGEGAGVVYARTLDALIDLVVSLGRGDAGRAWAWRQVGLVDDVSYPEESVAVALSAHPELAPAALTAAARQGRIALTAAGWVAVSRAVQRIASTLDITLDAEARSTVDNVRSELDRSSSAPAPASAGRTESNRAAIDLVLGGPVGRSLPDAELSPAERVAIAGLAVLCGLPWLARSEPVVAGVAHAMAVRGPARTPGAVPTRRGLRPSAAAGRADATTAGGADATTAAGAETKTGTGRSGTAVGGGGVASAFGGVLFLVSAVTALDLVTDLAQPAQILSNRPFPWVLSELALRLSGAAIDDPVIAAVGLRTTDPDTGSAPVGPAEEAELGALAERVQAWLRERLGLHPDEELDWLWRRRVSIVAEPGWIEAEFSLDDVDIRIRAAGLDLDPGFVWWLGAVVSYRYV